MVIFSLGLPATPSGDVSSKLALAPALLLYANNVSRDCDVFWDPHPSYASKKMFFNQCDPDWGS